MRTSKMQHEPYSTGAPWEPLVGYSRPVRVATAQDCNIVGNADPYAQAVQVLKDIETALKSSERI